MPGFYDEFGPPDAFADAPDPATLQWPWSQPPPVDVAPTLNPIAAPEPLLAPQPVAAMPAPPPPDLAALPLPEGVPPPPPAIAPPIEAGAAAPPLPDLGGVGPAPPPAILPSTTDAQQQAALNQKALTNPEGFTEDVVRSDAARADYIAQRRKAMAEADIAAAKQHADDWKAADAATQVKMEAVLADAQRISDTKIDPTGGVSGGGRIASILAATIGGLVQGKTGAARNAGMDSLVDTINRGIDAQKADLANQREGVNLRKNVLAQEFARHGDMFRAEETVRLASLQHADDLLAFEQQNYDPRGRTGLLIASKRAEVAGAKATAIQAARQKDFENGLKLQDAARQQQLADETRRHNIATESLERAKTAAAQDKGPAFTPEQWKLIHPDNPVPPFAMNQKDYGSFLEGRVKGNEIGKNARERTLGGEVTPITDAQGNVTGRKLGLITMANGQPFEAKGTEQQVTQLDKQHTATVQLLGTLDEIRRIGPEWLSDTANSDKFQKLKQLMGTARTQSIAALNLGVPTGHDIELAEDFVGTTDPTRRKDSLAGIMSARDTLIRNHNVELKARGLDKDWNPPDLVSREKQPQPGDAQLEDAMRNPMRDMTITRIASELGLDPGTVASTHAAQRREVDAAFEANAGMLPSVKNTLDTIATDLQDADPKKREAAAAKLSKVSGAAGAAPAARSYASQLLTNSIAGNLPQVQEQVR